MLNNGETIGDRYKIVKHLNRGAMANAYEARCLRTNEQVFLKEYIAPRPSVLWYAGFVAHQRELTTVLRGSDAEQFCLLPKDTFEQDSRTTASGEKRRTPTTLYQTFEFIKGGLDVEKRLESSMSWDDRRMFASVFAFGLCRLHAAGVIHADLKPANLQIIERAGPRGPIKTPRLIDMDFSVLARKQAPWHGHNGYVGTAGYLSPEHIGGHGCAPLIASDVFSAGIILHELFGKGNPLRGLDDAEYIKRIRSGTVPAIELRGTFGRPDHDKAVIDVVRRCLAIKPANRPTSSELHQIITGTVAPLLPPDSDSMDAVGGSRRGPTTTSKLVLASGGVNLEVGVTTCVGRSLLARFGADSQFASPQQFRLLREVNVWYLEHISAAKNENQNETLLNGLKVVDRVRVKTGDRLSVGNSSKGIEKLSLQIELAT